MSVGLGKGFARAHFHELIHSAREKQKVYSLFKSSLDYPDLCEAADFLTGRLPGKLLVPMHGAALPTSYDVLGDNRYCSHGPTVQAEVNWLLLSVRRYSKEINLFLRLQKEFDRHLLRGNYDKADRALTRIEENVCFSLYTLENRFILNEYGKSAISNKKFLSDFNAGNRTVSQVRYLAHFLSIRAERGVSMSRYTSDINMNLAGISSSAHPFWYGYSHFKLNFLHMGTSSHHKEIISSDFQFSIIDRYLAFRQMCIALFTDNSTGDDETIELKKYVRNRLPYVVGKVKDPLLERLYGFEVPQYREFGQDSAVLPALDKYTVGLYSDAENILHDQLDSEPTRFDLYDLYTKCLIHQGAPFRPVGNPNSIQNLVLAAVYRLNSIDVGSEASASDLRRLASTLSSTQLSFGIHDFVNRHNNQSTRSRRLGLLSYSPDNPALFEQSDDSEVRKHWLNEFRKHFSNSVTVRLLMGTSKNPLFGAATLMAG